MTHAMRFVQVVIIVCQLSLICASPRQADGLVGQAGQGTPEEANVILYYPERYAVPSELMNPAAGTALHHHNAAPRDYSRSRGQPSTSHKIAFAGVDNKRFSEFLGGKRKRFSEFLGGKKRFSEFLGGKRGAMIDASDKEEEKRFSEFLGGKRSLDANLPSSENHPEQLAQIARFYKHHGQSDF